MSFLSVKVGLCCLLCSYRPSGLDVLTDPDAVCQSTEKWKHRPRDACLVRPRSPRVNMMAAAVPAATGAKLHPDLIVSTWIVSIQIPMLSIFLGLTGNTHKTRLSLLMRLLLLLCHYAIRPNSGKLLERGTWRRCGSWRSSLTL